MRPSDNKEPNVDPVFIGFRDHDEPNPAADEPEKDTKMVAPTFTMRQLLEAGVHFGHQTHRWNPKMSQYIFGVRNGIHIIDLEQTVPMLHRALDAVRDIVSSGGRVLFVAPSARHRCRSRKRPSDAGSITSTTDGLAAC